MQVLTYADCAVNPSPDAEQLAHIALSSADTAAAFGLQPRVAMLSYSTLGSGAGPDVDLVRLQGWLMPSTQVANSDTCRRHIVCFCFQSA